MWVYIFAFLLYLLPSAFLWAAWRREAKARLFDQRPEWRDSCLRVAYFAAAWGTGLSLMFLVSFLYNGGGIHGSQTSPGIWNALGPISAGIVVLSFFDGHRSTKQRYVAFGRLVVGSLRANYAIFQLAFD